MDQKQRIKGKFARQKQASGEKDLQSEALNSVLSDRY